jgi:hypothetical protein
MEARAMLPRRAEIKTFLVERDAVVNMFNENVVFACVNSHIKMIPVKVTGYQGIMAGIDAPELVEGMKVVVKGNERLMDGQMIEMLTPDTDLHLDNRDL